MAALQLMKGKPRPTATDPTGRLISLLIHSQKTLTYLGVINIDRLDQLDQKKIPLLAGNIVNTVSKRWPPHGAMGPKPKLLPQLAGAHPGAIMRAPVSEGPPKP